MNGFGKVIWTIRHEHNMSQPMFADLVSGLTGTEITRSAVSMWERGLRVPKADVIIKIANAFSMDVDEVLGVAKESPLYTEGNQNDSPFPEITMIARAGKKMSPERRADMIKLLKIAFPEEFND